LVAPTETRERLLRNVLTTDWTAFMARHAAMNKAERAAMLARIASLADALQRPRGLYELMKDVRPSD
jgi:hypothetical protein